ncbi:MAG: hypothetical protein K0S74_1684 [Chlamydiales bacterium]|jgi:hypothetical protein|nr:hypothetical protein [Chlamydiales bacterium]
MYHLIWVLLLLSFLTSSAAWYLAQYQSYFQLHILSCSYASFCWEKRFASLEKSIACNRSEHEKTNDLNQSIANPAKKRGKNKQKSSVKRYIHINPLEIPESAKLNIDLALAKQSVSYESAANVTYDKLLHYLLVELYGPFFPLADIKKLVESLVAGYQKKQKPKLHRLEDLLNLLDPKENEISYRLLCKMLHGLKDNAKHPYKKLDRYLTTANLLNTPSYLRTKINFHYAEPELIKAIFSYNVASFILQERDDCIQLDKTLVRTILTVDQIKEVNQQYSFNSKEDMKTYIEIFSFIPSRK